MSKYRIVYGGKILLSQKAISPGSLLKRYRAKFPYPATLKHVEVKSRTGWVKVYT